MKVKEIIEILERYAPADLQESYDNTGIQVGDIEADVKGILISVDVTEDTIDEALDNDCNMIVAHHPLLFRGMKKVIGSDFVQRVVIKAIKHDVVIFAAHTNLDKCEGGVSWRMAEWLGLSNVSVLVPDTRSAVVILGTDKSNSQATVGLGCVGDFPNEMTEQEALLFVKKTFNVQCVRHSSLTGRMVKRIALCGGSGAEFIEDAKKVGAELYITADLKYHDFFTAENKIVIADIGHFESEQVTKEIFYAEISKLFPKFAVRMSYRNQNAVHYI